MSVTAVGQKGKFAWVQMSGDWTIWLTMGLSGNMSNRRTQFSHVHLVFDTGTVFFNDKRRFGTIDFRRSVELTDRLATLGPDILLPISDESWLKRFRTREQWTIPKAMMDQKTVSGIGNYLKAEALYECRVSPLAEIRWLSDNTLIRLKHAVQKLANDSYRAGGVAFKCYGRGSDPFNSVVEARMTDDGRKTYWVPDRQTNLFDIDPIDSLV